MQSLWYEQECKGWEKNKGHRVRPLAYLCQSHQGGLVFLESGSSDLCDPL